MKQPPSIFNDVIGPVMRGPSSSHAAASARIGNLIKQMVKGQICKVLIEFDPNGSLATTYKGHGTDIGIIGGLLGFKPQDYRLPLSLQIAKEEGLEFDFSIIDYQATHPNTYRITVLSSTKEKILVTAISTGGGMIDIQEINNFKVSIKGDFYETLIFTTNKNLSLPIEKLLKEKAVSVEFINILEKDNNSLINIKATQQISDSIINQIENMPDVNLVMSLSNVLPILSSKNLNIPFTNSEEMLLNSNNKSLWELAAEYESQRGKISIEKVLELMKEIVTLMDNSIKEGLKGTEYKDRLLGRQSHLIEEGIKSSKIIYDSVMNNVIKYITAMMEVKSSMGVIVAAPTAGSCGTLPGTILGACDTMGLNLERATKAMLAAGIVGVFIAERATFAAEVAGCQVECGAGSAMAAAGLVELMGGTAKEAIDAASMALQNVIGIVCDPVADRVEVPCLGKNIMGGVNALACANMAVVGFDKVIQLDETIDAMYKVGKMLPSELRCTGKGGLSITHTAQKLEKWLINRNSL